MKPKTIFQTDSSVLALSGGIVPTQAERAAGRLMRAPDHGAGGGDSGNAGGTDGGADSAAGAGDDAGNAGGAGDGGSGDAAADGNADSGSGASGDGADGAAKDGGKADGGDGGSILSDAARDDTDDKAEGGEGAETSETPRLTFGEGDDAADILGAPETYELQVPADLAEKGMTFDKEMFDKVEPVMRELNLSAPAAQKLIDAYARDVIPAIEARGARNAETVGADMRRGWNEESEAAFDGKDGRPSLKEAKALSRQAFLATGIKADSPFLTLLEESGLGNHPEMLRVFSSIGRRLGEAPVDPGKGGEEKLRLADKVYGQPVPRTS